MILIVADNESIHTALKPIIVYKVLLMNYKENRIFDLYMKEFEYTIGKLYRLRKPLKIIKECGYCMINEYYEKIERRIINNGFHAFCDIQHAKSKLSWFGANNSSYEIFRCIIPKRAKYCLGKNGEIISTSIRVMEKIKKDY